MRLLGRLIAGGLFGLAVALLVLGNGMWVAHAVGAAVAIVCMGIEAAARAKGQGSWVWSWLPIVVLGVVIYVCWW